MSYMPPSCIFCQASGIVIERCLVPQTHATCSKASQQKKKNNKTQQIGTNDLEIILRLCSCSNVVQHVLFSPSFKSQLASKRCKTRHSATCSSVKNSAIANHLTLRKHRQVPEQTSYERNCHGSWCRIEMKENCHEMLAQNRTQPPLIFSSVVLLKV